MPTDPAARCARAGRTPRPGLFASAAYRIAFGSAAAFACANLLLGIFVYLAAHGAIKAQLEGQIADDSVALRAEFREGGRRELAAAIREREAGGTTNQMVYALFSSRGRRIAGSMDARRPPEGWSDIGFLDPVEGPDTARALAVDLTDGTRLVVAADKEGLEQIDDNIVSLFAAGFGLILLCGLGIALLVGRYLHQRLDAVGTAAEAIIAGRMTERIPLSPRHDEFDRLAATLNAMLDRITELMTHLRQVSSDIAHDLRTPLARLRQQLEDSLARPPEPQAQRATLEEAAERIDEVLGLFAAILRISTLEGSQRRAFAPLDLSALAQDLCESYAPAVEDGGRHLACHSAPGIVIDGDRELIAQAIINLLDNAQIHTPPGTHIRLDLTAERDGIFLSVTDDGPGVPEADRERITGRFIRLEASRSTPGHGLGLNLVQTIARAHGGTIRIGDAAPGLVVTLDLPRRA